MLEIAKAPSEQKWHIMLSDFRSGCDCYKKRLHCDCESRYDSRENYYFTIKYDSGSRWVNLGDMHQKMIDFGCNFLNETANAIPQSEITLAWCRDIYLYTVFFSDAKTNWQDRGVHSSLIEITYIDEKHFSTDVEYYTDDFAGEKTLLVNPNLTETAWSKFLKQKHGR